MTTIGWITFIVLLLGYFTFVIWGLVLDMDILTQVNARLPQDKQFPWIGSHRRFELRRQYKILFPEGKLHSQSTRLWLAGFLCLFAATAAF